MLGAGLRELERAGAEVEGGQSAPLGERRSCVLPVEPPRDHEVEHEEQLAVQLDHDPFSQAREAGDRPTFDGREWWFDRPEEERARNPDVLQPRAQDAWLERHASWARGW